MSIEGGDGEIPTVPARRRSDVRESGQGPAGPGRGGLRGGASAGSWAV